RLLLLVVLLIRLNQPSRRVRCGRDALADDLPRIGNRLNLRQRLILERARTNAEEVEAAKATPLVLKGNVLGQRLQLGGLLGNGKRQRQVVESRIEIAIAKTG